MKVFVTVGTTPFDQLIEQVERQLSDSGFDLTCQIAQGAYEPTLSFIQYADNFSQWFDEADIVITHGGAGTVFELLDRGKKFVLVPNLYRIDKHQQDLAQFVEANDYAMVCWTLDGLAQCVEQCIVKTFTPYHKETFFMADDLLQYFDLGQC